MKTIYCIAALLVAGPTLAFEGPFKSLKFNDALTLAKKERKVVFIDFYTTWCGPCKMLDRTTWKDPNVVRWLQEKTVPLKIDAEVETALAKKFKVEGYPSLVFVNHDGSLINSRMGYLNAEKFLQIGKEILAGQDPLEKEKKALLENSDKNPSDRMAYAGILMKQGHYQQALDAYLWCFDEGHIVSPPFMGVRNSFLMRHFSRLSKKYPPTIAALEFRRDAIKNKIEEKNAKSADYVDVVSLNKALGTEADSLAIFDAMTDETEKKLLGKRIYGQLVAEKRYTDIAETFDLAQEVETCFKRYDQYKNGEPFEGMDKKDIEDLAYGYLTRTGSQLYQVLLGLDRGDEAQKLAARMLAVNGNASTHGALAWSGYLSGRPSQVNLDQAEKAYELSGGKDARVVRALAMLMATMNQQNKALSLLNETLLSTSNKMEKKMLEQALEKIKGS